MVSRELEFSYIWEFNLLTPFSSTDYYCYYYYYY